MPSNSISAIKGQQAHFGVTLEDSFLKVLLRVQTIQSSLLRLLTQKLVQYSMNVDSVDDHAIAIDVLNHIKYCEVVYSPRYLLFLWADVLPILSPAMQVEVISALPGRLILP